MPLFRLRVPLMDLQHEENRPALRQDGFAVQADQNFSGFTRTEGPMVLLRYRERT